MIVSDEFYVFSCKHSLHRCCLIKMLQSYEASEGFELKSSDKVRSMVKQVLDLHKAIEDDTDQLRNNWTKQTEKQNDLIAKTTKTTLAMFEGFRRINKELGETALIMGTGGLIDLPGQSRKQPEE